MPRYKNRYGEGTVQRRFVFSEAERLKRSHNGIEFEAFRGSPNPVGINEALGIALGSDGFFHPIEVTEDGELKISAGQATNFNALMLNELIKIRFLLERVCETELPQWMIGED